MEHFYPTLALVNMRVHQKTGRVEQEFDKKMLEELNRFRARRTFWDGSGHSCHGWVSRSYGYHIRVVNNTTYFKIRREICNLALGDLPAIIKTEGFVMNKFVSDIDASVVDCLQHFVYS